MNRNLKDTKKITLSSRKKIRASILMASVLMMTIAGVATTSWIGYINEATRGAARDRDRMHAFYAAEAGIERAVDFFNNTNHYTGEEPTAYTAGIHPAQYAVAHPQVIPDWYPLFEPYILGYAIDGNGNPLYRDGRLFTNRTTYFRNLAAGSDILISKTSKIPSCDLDISTDDNLVFHNPNGNVISRVQRLRLINPSEVDFAANGIPSNLRIITFIQSTGVTPSGVEVTISSVITESATFQISSPGPIVSRASVTYNGNFNVAWGEVWATEDVALPSNWTNKISTRTQDPWFAFRVQGVLKDHKDELFADGRQELGFSIDPVQPGTQAYTVPFHPDTLWTPDRGNKKSDFEGYDNMFQNQLLSFPDYDYNQWKTFVMANNFRYYFTDTSGNVYGTEMNPTSPDFGRTVSKSFEAWFGSHPTNADYDDLTQKVVFIDTVPVDNNGNPGPRDENNIPIINDTYYPRNPSINDGDPAARLATIRLGGGSLHTRGAFFIAANMDMNGAGNPPSTQVVPNVVRPDLTPPQNPFRISHNGFIYSWGEVSGGGNRTVYGSIYTERGFSANGDPSVYYDVRLQDGSWINLNVSRVRRFLWSFTDYSRFSES
jgi:hypothetical protein